MVYYIAVHLLVFANTHVLVLHQLKRSRKKVISSSYSCVKGESKKKKKDLK